VRHDGSLVWGLSSISLLNRTPPLVVAIVENITEKRKAEEVRFGMPLSSNRLRMRSTQVLQRIFGYTESEALGQPITILIPPELRDEESKILEWLRAGKRIEYYETIRMTKAVKR
jgi:hypothetical protein